MLSEFRRRKLRLIFNYNDLDRNGLISAGDYDQVVANYGEAYGYSPDHPDYQQLKAQYGLTWAQLQAFDADGDGMVSLDEFMAGYERWLADKDAFLGWLDNVVASFYAIVDRDKDGIISEDELVMNLQAHGQPESTARNAFAKLDRNGDGGISHDEMVLNIEEAFYSEDPEAPGNWIALMVAE